MKMEWTEICKKIVKKHPFVYMIKGRHYLIGSNIFRKCNDEEINHYKSFLKEYSTLKLNEISNTEKYDIGIDELKKLATSIKFLITVSDENLGENMSSDCKEILRSLSQEEYEELNNQVLQFENAWYYMRRYDIFSKNKEENQK